MSKYYMIGNTHFDPVWEWKWDEAMSSIRATFRSAQTDRCASPPRFISHRERIGGSPVHAPRAVSSSNILTPTKTKKDALTDIFPVLAGVVRLELTARGFGEAKMCFEQPNNRNNSDVQMGSSADRLPTLPSENTPKGTWSSIQTDK